MSYRFLREARLKASDAASFNDAMEDLEKILVDRIGRLRAAVTEGQAVVADEAKEAEQAIESLRANIAALEAKLRDTEDTTRRKDVESQRIQEALDSKIGDLQTEVHKKEEALESRGSEVNALTSKVDVLENKVDVLEKQVTDLKLAIQQAKEQAASEAQRAENIIESSKAKIATIDAQFRETEQIVRGKDATIKALGESLTAQIHDLENQLRNKEVLLAEQIGQVTDLKSELQRLTPATKETSTSAGGLAVPGSGRAVVNEPGGEEKSPTSDFRNGGVTPNVTDADRETVSLEVFDRMIDGLFEVTDVARPIASLIVRNHIESLGESMEDFPQTRLSELLEALSGEISDDKLRTAFRQRLAKL